MHQNQVKEIEQQRLITKSIEAFIMGLEIYNKPTIMYRIEGFSFFIVNAWELMLKAELIKRGQSIYFDDDPDRTIPISNTIRRIYTDKNTRVRLNLEKIIDLRNISTHYITEDYEIKYVPLFQACVLNFVNEIQRFHKKDITEYIQQNFLTISASYNPLTNEQIKLKYPPEIAEKFINQANEIEVLSKEYHSDKFAIDIRQNLYITKKFKNSDFSVSVNKNSDNKVTIIKELKDPSNTHKYNYNSVIIAVNERLKNSNITFDYDKGFNTHVLNLMIDFYDIKQNKDYSYNHVIGKQSSYTYSQGLIDFIVKEIKKNRDNFYESLKKT